MEWLNDLAARFPAPREDEPADLRRRIVAELRDHLLSAFQRELLLTGNAETAKQNILVRFGDPARLARKLWFDAMWEKIMSQRMTLVALVVVVLVSLGSMCFTWLLLNQAREINQALLEQSRAANEAMLAEARKASGDQAAENRAANLALLAKFAPAAGAAGSPPPSMEWNPLKVRLFAENDGGPPASGFEVTLRGRLLDTGKDMKLIRTTGGDGVADFGLVRPGEHSLDIATPWNEITLGQPVTVLPGEAQTLDLVCPPILEDVNIAITVDWPAALEGRDLWLVCDFIRSPRKIAGRWWNRRSENVVQFVAIQPSGKLINFDYGTFPNKMPNGPSHFF